MRNLKKWFYAHGVNRMNTLRKPPPRRNGTNDAALGMRIIVNECEKSKTRHVIAGSVQHVRAMFYMSPFKCITHVAIHRLPRKPTHSVDNP